MKKISARLGILCLLTFSLLFAGCSAGSSTQKGSASSSGGQSAQAEHAEEVVIGTAYGDLYYPAQWEEFLQVDQTEENGRVQAAFSGKIDETLYPLFTISIGSGDGVGAGMLTGKDGTQRQVYVQIAEITGNAALSQIELNRLYAMQEDLNYLIDHLK